MGQLFFIPYDGGGGGGASNDATLVGGFFNSVGNQSFFGAAGTADAFAPGAGDVTIGVAFRIKAKNGIVSPGILSLVDGGGNGWEFNVTPGSGVFAVTIDGDNLKKVQTTVPGTDVPLGRLFVMVYTYNSGTGTANLYMNGLPVDEQPYTPAAATPGSTLLVATSTWEGEVADYLGWFYVEGVVDKTQNEQIFVQTLDNKRVTLPSSVTALGSYALYNADDGLTNLAQWSPDAGSTITLDIPWIALGTGPAEPTLSTVDVHPAYSGWATLV